MKSLRFFHRYKVKPNMDILKSEQLVRSNPDTNRIISGSIAGQAQELGQVMGVIDLIHPQDQIFWSIYDGFDLPDGRAAVQEYFNGGRSAAEAIKAAILPFSPETGCRILDFAAGYCRVSRHLKVTFPECEVVVVDIHAEALDFASSVGLSASPSTWKPDEFRPDGLYDLIVAISFFRHMPKEVWASWLLALGRSLKAGGRLLFTTHGIPAMAPMGLSEADIDSDGFAFYPHSEQKDLDLDKYASTTTLFSFVMNAIKKSDMRILYFREAGFGYQDIYVLTV